MKRDLKLIDPDCKLLFLPIAAAPIARRVLMHHENVEVTAEGRSMRVTKWWALVGVVPPSPHRRDARFALAAVFRGTSRLRVRKTMCGRLFVWLQIGRFFGRIE